LAASFISNQACDVAYWHLVDKPTAPAFVRYWTNNGQRATLGLDGSVANDPKQTCAILLANHYSLIIPIRTT
jgi:hypothetical protein